MLTGVVNKNEQTYYPTVSNYLMSPAITPPRQIENEDLYQVIEEYQDVPQEEEIQVVEQQASEEDVTQEEEIQVVEEQASAEDQTMEITPPRQEEDEDLEQFIEDILEDISDNSVDISDNSVDDEASEEDFLKMFRKKNLIILLMMKHLRKKKQCIVKMMILS